MTMTCQEARDTLAGRFEHPGSNERWRGFEQHMTACPECDRQLRRTESIRRILRQCCRRVRAPQSLRSSIAIALPHRVA